jgi:tetratricopeptide (TPR) repeat protein
MLTTEHLDVGAEVERLYQEAQTRWRGHHTEDAAALLARALEMNPQHAASLSLYGLCLANRGLEYQRALASCRQAVRQEPHNVTFHLNIAKVYKQMGDHGAAYKVMLRAWRANPKDARAAAELARMGVRQQPPLRFLPRSHFCNRMLGRLRTRLHGSWSRMLTAQRMQKAGHEV